ncbi:MAG: glycerate kinase type-2 family protein [Bacteroidota bacterium]
MDAKTVAKNLFLEALELCSPEAVVEQTLQVSEGSIHVDHFDALINGPIHLFAVGKAAISMYEGAISKLQSHPVQSLVITSEANQAKRCQANEVLIGSHPTPDKNSLKAGERAIRFMEGIPEKATLLNLISGGTSSLLSMPAAGISISALSRTFDLLNKSGAAIHQINTVRKHCSQIKGGQLLRHVFSDITIINLAISDVPNDDLSIIGSGPTVSDNSTFGDARYILKQFKLWQSIPGEVRKHIQKGVCGEIPETVKPDEQIAQNIYSKVISSASKLASTIADLAKNKGFEVVIADQPFNDDVKVVASEIAEVALAVEAEKSEGSSPELLIYWGESTVKVIGEGKGGRNQELALRGAQKIAGHGNIIWLSAGTDGVDGPTDAAGALVDGDTIRKAKVKNINPETYLAKNDSYHFHQQLGTLFKTGATGNNVMDVVLVMVE